MSARSFVFPTFIIISCWWLVIHNRYSCAGVIISVGVGFVLKQTQSRVGVCMGNFKDDFSYLRAVGTTARW